MFFRQQATFGPPLPMSGPQPTEREPMDPALLGPRAGNLRRCQCGYSAGRCVRPGLSESQERMTAADRGRRRERFSPAPSAAATARTESIFGLPSGCIATTDGPGWVFWSRNEKRPHQGRNTNGTHCRRSKKRNWDVFALTGDWRPPRIASSEAFDIPAPNTKGEEKHLCLSSPLNPTTST